MNGSLLSGLWANGKSRLGLLVVVAFVLTCVVGPFLVVDPDAFLGVPLQPPSAEFWLGTTGQGQDVLAQTVVGARTTLLIGALSGFCVVAIGALVGGLAGFYGGRVDDVASVLINVFLVLPGLPLMVVIAAWLPAGPVTMLIVLVVTGWAWNARVLRSQVLSLRKKDFVAAALVSGESPARVVVAEILPNMASLLVSSFIGATVYGIGAQVGLEFLGLGDISTTTWGTNLYWASNDAALLTESWWTFVPTGLCIALVGFGLSMLNFGIDELTNPRLAASRHAAALSSGPAPSATPVVRGV